jgi:hypothetical protein
MNRKLLIAPLLALGLAALPAAALSSTAPAAKEASIDLANSGGIRDWREVGDQTIYVQDRQHRWYRATLMRPSYDLRGALAIGFDTGPGDTFDKFSSVVIRGQRYAVESLVRIEGSPPSEARKHKSR